MPSSCCVVGCRSRGNIPQGIQFFQLPLNRPKVLTQWLIVLDRRDWIPKPSSRICSLHFSSEDYLQRINQSVGRLKPEAIPSLFPDLNDVQDGDESLSTNLNDNTTKTDEKSPVIPLDSGEISKNATPTFIDTPRPRRVSKLNVKMKDFILLDDIKKHRSSPTSELQDTPQPSEKEKAAQELLSILEDSNSLSGNESEKDLNILGNSNIVLNKLDSDINNSTNVVLLSKKGPKEDLSSSTSKLASVSKTSRPGPKSSKKKLVNISSKLDHSEEIASKSVLQKLSSSKGIIKQSDDASKNQSARKKTYQIKHGGRFYYFSYSDLNPVVDLSINNKYKEYISKNLSESEPAATGDNSKTAIEPEVVTEDKEPPVEQDPENVPLTENISDVENDVNTVNNAEILSEDANDVEVDVQSESGSVEYLPTNKGVKRKMQAKKKNIRKKPIKAKNLKRKRTSVINEVSSNNNQSGHNKTADQNVSSHQTDEGVEALLSEDEYTNQLESNKKLTTSTKKSVKRKRFKTVAEIVVRTDTTGQVPSVSIDKIVDLESTETPLSKKPRRTRTRYFPSSAVSPNGVVGKSPSEDDHFNKLSSQIVDTIKKMRIIENVQGARSSKLTVLITTLPPVEVNELLVIKKKNIETNYEQSHELQVAISNYNNTDKMTMGNNENDSFIPVIAACDKGLAANIVNKAVVNSENLNQVPADSDGSSENRDPNVAHGCLNAANFSVNTPLKVINGQLGNDISSSVEIAEGSTDVQGTQHDHTYNSSGMKIIGDLEIIDEQFTKINKLSDDEINYRNKVHRKVRSLKENVKRKTESIQKLKEKIKFLEKTIREERKTKKRFGKQRASRSLEPDTLYASMVDSDIPDTVDYSNAELPSQYDDNMDDSEEESKGCSSPITYLCEPAIDICEDAAPEE